MWAGGEVLGRNRSPFPSGFLRTKLEAAPRFYNCVKTDSGGQLRLDSEKLRAPTPLTHAWEPTQVRRCSQKTHQNYTC